MTHGVFVCFQRNHSPTEYYTDRFENKEIIVTRREIKFFVFLICVYNVMFHSVDLNVL